jgi:hypothetical protein
MSIIYSSKESGDGEPISGELDSYRMWFDMHHMDFSVECRDNKWSCSAWFRGKWGGAEGFSYDNIMQAVHSCYIEAKKEIASPSVRKRDWSPS